ncbi:putative chalcone--flavonone isomerase [Iris pallida]|uniref:Chalcone-flavonone isomerase family protein n=1 Tax=Iris pallida TaxID=29817 RepID=A0AAX6FUR9_IRIPA|nr:putative chalcone--flavonone isomerase [Iris pallida]
MGEVSPVPVTELEVDGVLFPPVLTPPGSSKAHFLGGAGVRGMDIGGNFVRFTSIGVYLEKGAAIEALSAKWKGKTAEELVASVEFFRDITMGSFDKFTKVTMILPLTGKQYAEKVCENCVAHWKAIGIYTDAEAAAVEKFKQVLEPETFPPGSSILFHHSATGTLTIAFSKDESIPEAGVAVIENRPLTVAILESIIGEHGVSPAAKQSLALRVASHLNQVQSGQTVNA